MVDFAYILYLIGAAPSVRHSAFRMRHKENIEKCSETSKTFVTMTKTFNKLRKVFVLRQKLRKLLVITNFNA